MKNKPIITKKKNGGYLVDWNRFLSPKKNSYTRAELEKAAAAAYNWDDCACGRQDKRIPRDFDGSPLDMMLSDYGCRFADFIFRMFKFNSAGRREQFNLNLKMARRTIRKIDIRSAQILKELKSKQQAS